MVIVQLMYNDYPAMVLEAKTPKALKGIFNLARIENYTVNIHRGWEYAWVQTAFQNFQEELVAE